MFLSGNRLHFRALLCFFLEMGCLLVCKQSDKAEPQCTHNECGCTLARTKASSTLVNLSFHIYQLLREFLNPRYLMGELLLLYCLNFSVSILVKLHKNSQMHQKQMVLRTCLFYHRVLRGSLGAF